MVNQHGAAFYQERPPPPPEPPPEEPPPELLPEPLEGLEAIALFAVLIVDLTKVPKDLLEKVDRPEYQLGGGMLMVSNLLIHLSLTPKT